MPVAPVDPVVAVVPVVPVVPVFRILAPSPTHICSMPAVCVRSRGGSAKVEDGRVRGAEVTDHRDHKDQSKQQEVHGEHRDPGEQRSYGP